MDRPAAALAALALSLLVPVAVQADETPTEDKTLAPYFYIGNGDPAVDRLPLKATEVEVKVAGIIADVTVTLC